MLSEFRYIIQTNNNNNYIYSDLKTYDNEHQLNRYYKFQIICYVALKQTTPNLYAAFIILYEFGNF